MRNRGIQTVIEDSRVRKSERLLAGRPTLLPVPRSLQNSTLKRPPPVETMMSFNTLTPHYAEDVIYALSASDVAKQLGLEGPGAAAVRAP